jgi:Cu/Zn superoxide dismutase
MRFVVGICVATLATATVVAVSAAAGPTKYSASMSGTKEIPKNASKATGKATVTVTGKRLCYVITTTNLGEVPLAAHIHSAKAGKAGPVFVALFGKAKALKHGKVSGCVTTTAAKLKAIAAKPSAFYANVHTQKYPAGALRGQLKKG